MVAGIHDDKLLCDVVPGEIARDPAHQNPPPDHATTAAERRSLFPARLSRDPSHMALSSAMIRSARRKLIAMPFQHSRHQAFGAQPARAMASSGLRSMTQYTHAPRIRANAHATTEMSGAKSMPSHVGPIDHGNRSTLDVMKLTQSNAPPSCPLCRIRPKPTRKM